MMMVLKAFDDVKHCVVVIELNAMDYYQFVTASFDRDR